MLSDEVASQVAAGEVVERPASVVKELVENSIDADARHIEVTVRRGGISLIRVVDDGVGMDRDDALLCIERHATSKIRTGADLAAIQTLGFRGEALPSIASVSRFKLFTRQHRTEVGTELSITGGKLDYVRDGGGAPGTQIEVRSLFFNLPARRKFLRTENTELSHIEQHLHNQAIGHPEIGFTLRTDDRLVFQVPPAHSLKQRIRDLCGGTLADELLEIPEYSADGIRIFGFLGRPRISRSTRAQQLSFVNGRVVENSAITHGLREGYHTALMKGQYPVTFLFIELPPEAVDVNVHPAKREVRFREPIKIREALVTVVRQTLETDRTSWSSTFAAPAPEPGLPPRREEGLPTPPRPQPTSQPTFNLSALMAPVEGSSRPVMPLNLEQEPKLPVVLGPKSVMPVSNAAPAMPSSFPPPNPEEEAGAFRVLGVIGNLYIVMESESGLVLVDQHAAHERILFEELRRRMEQEGVPVQRLLMPVTLELSPRDSDWVAENLDALQKMGIGVSPFGNGTWMVDSLPQFIRQSEPMTLLRQVIDELRPVSNQASKLRLGEEVIAKTVCRAAVKANDVLREPEMVRLIQDLIKCELPYCCPHGRPTMIQISYAELEKKFGRKV